MRSAASFALARGAARVEAGDAEPGTQVTAQDLIESLREVPAASGRRQSELVRRYETHGVARLSGNAMLLDELQRFIRPPPPGGAPRVESLLLTAGGRGSGVTALAAWAAAQAMESAAVDYARVVSMAELAGASDEGARCGALAEVFAEAAQAGSAVLVLDDVDRITAGHGPDGASPALLGTLRALLRMPLRRDPSALKHKAPMMLVIATTSSGRAACTFLEGIFDTVRIAPLVASASDAEHLLRTSPSVGLHPSSVGSCAASAVEGGALGAKTILALASRAASQVAWEDGMQAQEEGAGVGGSGGSTRTEIDDSGGSGGSGSGSSGVGVRQEDAMTRLVAEWRLQEDAASSSCGMY